MAAFAISYDVVVLQTQDLLGEFQNEVNANLGALMNSIAGSFQQTFRADHLT
jgi:hypothetical protein